MSLITRPIFDLHRAIHVPVGGRQVSVTTAPRTYRGYSARKIEFPVNGLGEAIYMRYTEAGDRAPAGPANGLIVPKTATYGESFGIPAGKDISIAAMRTAGKLSYDLRTDRHSVAVDGALAAIAAGSAGHRVPLRAALSFPFCFGAWINAAAMNFNAYVGVLDNGETNNSSSAIGTDNSPTKCVGWVTPAGSGSTVAKNGGADISIATWYFVALRILGADDAHFVLDTTLSDATWDGGAASWTTDYDYLFFGNHYALGLYHCDVGDKIAMPFVANRDLTAADLTALVTNKRHAFAVFGDDLVGFADGLTDVFTGKPAEDFNARQLEAATAPAGHDGLDYLDINALQHVPILTAASTWQNNGGHGLTRALLPVDSSISVDGGTSFTNYAAGVHYLRLGVDHSCQIKKQGGAEDSTAQFCPAKATAV